jgi:hypothetical protein
MDAFEPIRLCAVADDEAARDPRAIKARRMGRDGLWLRVGMDLYELLCSMPTETSGAAVYFQVGGASGKITIPPTFPSP